MTRTDLKTQFLNEVKKKIKAKEYVRPGPGEEYIHWLEDQHLIAMNELERGCIKYEHEEEQ